MFGHNAELWSCNAQYCVWQKANTAHQHNHFVQAVKHSGDMMMMMITGPGHLAVTGLTMNSWLYKSILGSDVRPSVWELKLRWTWVMKLDDDPKQARKSPTEWLKKRKESSICNGQTSCTTMWEIDKVIKKRWFCKLLNHCVYVVFHRNASLFWLGFC